MAERSCGASVYACAARIAVLSSDGVPLPGAGNLYVTDALMSLEATPQFYAPPEIEVPNGCGALSVTYRPRRTLKRYDLTLNLTVVDPELEYMLVGGEKFTSSGYTVGASVPGVGEVGAPNGVSVELWSKFITNGDVDSVTPYLRWVLPRTYWEPDKIMFDQNHMPRTFTGYTTQNPNWFNGPANDWTYSSDRTIAYAKTTTIPVPVCGAQTLAAS